MSAAVGVDGDTAVGDTGAVEGIGDAWGAVVGKDGVLVAMASCVGVSWIGCRVGVFREAPQAVETRLRANASPTMPPHRRGEAGAHRGDWLHISVVSGEMVPDMKSSFPKEVCQTQAVTAVPGVTVAP